MLNDPSSDVSTFVSIEYTHILHVLEHPNEHVRDLALALLANGAN